MQDYTETLRVGSRAPDFTLRAANRDGEYSLAGFLKDGNLIVDFLRGTW
jgi:peroxiredoxin